MRLDLTQRREVEVLDLVENWNTGLLTATVSRALRRLKTAEIRLAGGVIVSSSVEGDYAQIVFKDEETQPQGTE